MQPQPRRLFPGRVRPRHRPQAFPRRAAVMHPRGADAEACIVRGGAAGLNGKSESLRGLSEPCGECVHVPRGDRHEIRHSPAHFPVEIHEAEDAEADEGGEDPGHGRKVPHVALHGIGSVHEHGIVAPGDALPSDNPGKLPERGHAFPHVRNPGLHIPAVGRDGVVAVDGPFPGEAREMRQKGAVVLGTEDNALHAFRREIEFHGVVRNFRVGHYGPAFPEALQEPGGVIVHNVRARTHVEDHASLLPGRGAPVPQARPESFFCHAGSMDLQWLSLDNVPERGFFYNPEWRQCPEHGTENCP